LKQSEAVLTYYFARAKEAIEFVKTIGDAHRFGASKVFEIPAEQVHKIQQQISKHIVHGSHYLLGEQHAGMMLESKAREYLKTLEPGPLRTSLENMIKAPILAAKRFQKGYFRAVPEILRWHQEIKEQVFTTRMLENPFGRRRIFLDRLGDELHRKAVAHLPQSTSVDITDEALIRMTDQKLLKRGEARLKGFDSWLLLQVHDEVVFEFKERDLGGIQSLMRECYDIPVEIHGEICKLQTEFKMSLKSWGEMEEIKK